MSELGNSSSEAGRYRPRIESFGRVHCALDYDMANVAFVEVDGGYVVIDTSAHPDTAERIRRDIEAKIGGRPQAIIFTHSHPRPYRWGCGVRRGVRPDMGQEGFAAELELYQLLPNSYCTRGAKQFGLWLGSERHPEVGIGPVLQIGEGSRPPVIYPTDTVSGTERLTLGGVEFVLMSTPGETHDHLSVWLPKERIIFSGDNIYEAFPNLYAIRGVAPRPVADWVDSLDAIRRLDPQPELLIPGHTLPVRGADEIHRLLTDYRDAIAWVLHSVVRGINAGKTPDQLVDEIRLPAHLENHPYLKEKYGTIGGAVRGIYAGYTGWFDGEPANLSPLLGREIADGLVPALGGEGALLDRVAEARDAGRLRWALWLLDVLIVKNPDRAELCERKADLLDRLGAAEPNLLHRNWLLTDAALLRGDIEPASWPAIDAATVAQLPVETLIKMLPTRIIPERTAGWALQMGYEFTDTGKQFTVFIRNGIGEVAPGLIDGNDVLVRATEADFKRILVAGERKPTSRRYWKDIEVVPPRPGLIGRLKMLRTLIRLRRGIMRGSRVGLADSG